MSRFVTLAVLVAFWVPVCNAQQQSDCPPRTVINNGVCRDENGNDCLSKMKSESPVCYDVDAQYTDEAAHANIKGTVVLWTMVGTDGCAHDIRVARGLGYGLDDAAVAALERFRFRRPAKPYRMNVEINFNPLWSSTTPVTVPKCEEVAKRSAGKK